MYSQTFVDRGVYRMWVKPARGLLEGRTYSTIFYCTSSGAREHRSARGGNARKYPFREDLVFGDDTQFAVDLCRNGITLRMIEEPLTIYRDLGDLTHSRNRQ